MVGFRTSARSVAIAGLVLLSALFLGRAGLALPVVSVDVDPGTPGIQAADEVALGDRFDVSIVLVDVSAAAPLNGFEIDLLFDPTVLSVASVTGGDFLLDPVFTLENTAGAGLVEFAAVTLLPTGAVGTGTLAVIEFVAAELGSSALSLENVLLAAPFGQPIPTAAIEGGFVEVVEGRGPTAPIPEPTAFVTFAAGLMVLRSHTAIRRRRAF